MSVWQRLRIALEARRSQRICRRCALGSPRYSSNSQQLDSEQSQQVDHGSVGASLERTIRKHRIALIITSLAPNICTRAGKTTLYPTICPLRTSRSYATAAVKPSSSTAHLDPPKRPIDANLKAMLNAGNIREHLKLWQEQHGKQARRAADPVLLLDNTVTASQNLYTQSGEDDSFMLISRDEEADDDDDVYLGSDGTTLELLDNYLFLRRGDMVELTAGNEPILAIFVRNLIDQCQFYTMRGEWVNRVLDKVQFAVSGFLHPDELDDVLPYLPAEEVEESRMDKLQPIDISAPRDAGAKVLEKMWLFHQAADRVFRSNADRINRAYEIIAPTNEREGRSHKSLRDIATVVLQKENSAELTHPMLWAVHRALVASQNITVDRINDRYNPVYEIHPQQSLGDFARVQAWVRQFQESVIEEATESFSTESALMKSERSQNPIFTFVHKTRAAIEQSRQTRPISTNGAIGPSSVKIEPVGPYFKMFSVTSKQTFSDEEKVIIRYLDAWVASGYINKHANLSALGPLILRAIGKYEDFELDQHIGFTLLQELGVVTPWENRAVYCLRGLRLPGHDSVSEESTRLRNKASQWVRAATRDLQGAGDEPIYSMHKLKDSMEMMRKDWGDLPVFCIDGADTLERDDGVSLQPIDGNPFEYWVHAHIANPSAFFAPDSPVGKYAAHLFESVYFPERKYPMLSPILSSNYFSLANGRPCLTFSARISMKGDILERKISSGIVRNVHYLTPQAAGLALGFKGSEVDSVVSLLSVGGEIPLKPEDDNPMAGRAVADSHIEILRTLLKLGEAARDKRVANGAPDFYSTAPTAILYPQVFLSRQAHVVKPFQISTGCIQQYDGDPILTIKSATEGNNMICKMVADLMIIAGEVAATWCMERNIPIPYRGMQRNPEPPMDPEEFKRNVIDPMVAKQGSADWVDLVQYMKLIGRTTSSASPLEHFAIGLPAYCKTTSPLRRYLDLYTHWQIEAALRHEAETGTSLIGSTDDSFLPFPRAEVAKFARTVLQRERQISLAKSWSLRHWIVQAFSRAFYFKQAPLPETFTVRVAYKQFNYQNGWLKDWNMQVRLNQNPVVESEGGFRVGNVWEAKIDRTEPYLGLIYMEPIRLIETETQSR
ncbi:hypothetical protein N7G274_005167 [Stereocaulon virgatum]|uniref:RNB domain-containing protein n=1 Tax=Stereocaulon virgatum TaxID=373712 RepID=A0ABR4A905_9LECA